MDLQNDIIAIKGTKTKYDRYIPASKPLKELLSNIDKKSEYVFCDKTGKKLTDFKRSFLFFAIGLAMHEFENYKVEKVEFIKGTLRN